MKRLIFLVSVLMLAASPALARKHYQYKVGTATPYRSTYKTTTTTCYGGANSVTCGDEDESHTSSIYSLHFADGQTRLIEHVLWTKNPLKSITGPTRVKYRLAKRMGVHYIYILDNRGKEGCYDFVSSKDDPTKHKASYGPASVK